MRYFSKTPLSLKPVVDNSYHDFAMRHALSIYDSNTIYSFVPKNACSSMRYSLARNNRFIKEDTDLDWYRSQNLTFCASQEFAATANYAFIILRCPFRRIASAYVDKVVTANLVVRSLYPKKWRKFQLRLMERSMYHGLSFRDFINRIAKIDRLELNEHWRPQFDFLLYDNYDDYFSLENISYCKSELKQKINFDFYDTRKSVGHDTSSFKKVSGSFANTPAGEIFNMRKTGELPNYESLYDPALIDQVAAIYWEDIDMYIKHFGSENLLFDIS